MTQIMWEEAQAEPCWMATDTWCCASAAACWTLWEASSMRVRKSVVITASAGLVGLSLVIGGPDLWSFWACCLRIVGVALLVLAL